LIDIQLDKWLLGESIHNTKDDMCCPDFSCCNKDMKTPKEVRERFYRAVKADDEQTKNEMLGMFLGQAMQTMGKDVYVAGLNTDGMDQ
jgi:hypothetical protein